MKRPLPFHSNNVWPSPLLVGLFIVLYGMIEVSFWLVTFSVQSHPMTDLDASDITNFREGILAIAAGVYAGYRLVRFHPVCNRAYAQWLKLSPWTAKQPLPIGPVYPVWQDAAVIGILTALAAWNHVNIWKPAVIFILVYLAGFTLILAFTRQWKSCLVLGFFWPALILPIVNGWLAFGILIAIAAVVWHGHRQSLKTFPWKFLETPPVSLSQIEIRFEGVGTPSSAGAQFNLGWAFLALSPKVRPPSISEWTSVALGGLAGWWSFCIIKNSAADPMPELILLFAIFAAFIRLGIYCIGVAAPVNVLGRIASGRFIIPGFDKVFLTPLAVILVAILGCIIIKRFGPWYPVTESCVIAAIGYVLFSGGPTLKNWALTGMHRLRPPTRANAQKQTLKSV